MEPSITEYCGTVRESRQTGPLADLLRHCNSKALTYRVREKRWTRASEKEQQDDHRIFAAKRAAVNDRLAKQWEAWSVALGFALGRCSPTPE